MKRILIAEDIKAILEKEGSFLNRDDIRTVTVSTNKEALALHSSEKADLIIVNLDMPEISSEKLCSLIREDKELRRVSIIVVCPDTESSVNRCSRCRANVFIAGMPDKTILLQKMHQLLEIAPRKSLRIPLSIEIHVVSKKRHFIAYAENISISGMLLHSEAPLFKGDIITCGFYLPDSTHVTANAEVIRVLEKGTEHDTNCYGIKFLNLSVDSGTAIRAFVEKEYRRNR